MALVQIKMAVLHDTMFLGGKNFDKKLDPVKYPDLTMALDTKTEVLKLWYNNDMANVNKYSGYAYTIPVESEERPDWSNRTIVQQAKIPQPVKSGLAPQTAGPGELARTAQVSSPMQHVFAGPGAGKTGK